jgi:hypothetical protein
MAPDQRAPAPLSWKAHPLIDESRSRSTLLCALIAGCSLAAGLSFEGLAYGLIALVVLLLSLSRYLLPTRYSLDEKGVEISHLGRRQACPWTQLRRLDIHENGIFLSPFTRASRLDSFRGYFLRFGREKNSIIDFARTHVAPE